MHGFNGGICLVGAFKELLHFFTQLLRLEEQISNHPDTENAKKNSISHKKTQDSTHKDD